jgi:hypothetical protein
MALIPRYALLRRTLALPGERQHLSDPRWRERLLQPGIFENDVPGRFTQGVWVQPAEIGPFFAQYGVEMMCRCSGWMPVQAHSWAAQQELSVPPTQEHQLHSARGIGRSGATTCRKAHTPK